MSQLEAKAVRSESALVKPRQVSGWQGMLGNMGSSLGIQIRQPQLPAINTNLGT